MKENRSLILLGLACLLIFLAGIAIPKLAGLGSSKTKKEKSSGLSTEELARSKRGPVTQESSTAAATAEEKVAGLVRQFAYSRRDIALRMGRKAGVLPPPVVEAFFAAIAAGDWAEIERQWKILAPKSGQYDGGKHDPTLDPFWPAMLDAYGVAEQAHLWPAERLLEYGKAIMDSLRPGTVYVGGTDPGRWIPTLVNEGLGEEQHLILTQNALADSRYIDYLSEIHSDRLQTISQEDSKRIIADFHEDARRRLEHDQNFPDEPRQVRPGENIRIVDGKVEVVGQPAVMDINERLLQMLMERNPDVSFAIEQSHAFESTYADATPVGPIMELRVQDEDRRLTQERAAESVNYWREVSGGLTDLNDHLRLAYGKLAANQAALFENRNFPGEAEQTYRLAVEMSPTSPEAIYGYANLLARQNRLREALPVIERAAQENPNNEALRNLLRQAREQGAR